MFPDGFYRIKKECSGTKPTKTLPANFAKPHFPYLFA